MIIIYQSSCVLLSLRALTATVCLRTGRFYARTWIFMNTWRRKKSNWKIQKYINSNKSSRPLEFRLCWIIIFFFTLAYMKFLFRVLYTPQRTGASQSNRWCAEYFNADRLSRRWNRCRSRCLLHCRPCVSKGRYTGAVVVIFVYKYESSRELFPVGFLPLYFFFGHGARLFTPYIYIYMER